MHIIIIIVIIITIIVIFMVAYENFKAMIWNLK